jgi:hypothetical protein
MTTSLEAVPGEVGVDWTSAVRTDSPVVFCLAVATPDVLTDSRNEFELRHVTFEGTGVLVVPSVKRRTAMN